MSSNGANKEESPQKPQRTMVKEQIVDGGTTSGGVPINYCSEENLLTEDNIKTDEDRRETVGYGAIASSSRSPNVPTQVKREDVGFESYDRMIGVKVETVVHEEIPPPIPADILPEEAWKDIFDTLDYPDRLNCFRARTKWRNYLMNKRTLLLFPEVLTLLKGSLPESSFLPLRSVNKKWKDDMDNASFTPKSCINFKTAEEIRQFMDDMESHSGNPFPLRCITLNYNTQQNLDNWDMLFGLQMMPSSFLFWSNVNELLDKFGEHVYTVSIYPNEQNEELQGYVEIPAVRQEQCIRNCLIRLPQLQRLTISNDRWEGDRALANRIQAFFNVNPLPRLPYLKEVEFKAEHDDFPGILANSILESCCLPDVVRKVIIMNAWGVYDTIFNFPNLTELQAPLSIEEVERLCEIGQPLRKITIRVKRQMNVSAIDFEKLISSLETFGMTLKHLKLKTSYVFCMNIGNVNTFRVKLPKLKSLVLHNYDGLLDTFYGLSALKQLVFEGDHAALPIDINGRNLAEYVEGHRIWKEDSSLETLCFEGARVGYKKRRFCRKDMSGIEEREMQLTDWNQLHRLSLSFN